MPDQSLFVAMPAFGHMVLTDTMTSMFNLGLECTRRNIPIGCSTVSYPDLTEIRNRLLTYWYDRTTTSHMLFVDADTGWDHQTVFEMLDADKPLIGAIYRVKRHPVEFAVREFPTKKPIVGNIMEVEGIPMGLTLIRRDCIETMLKHYGDELLDKIHPDRQPSPGFTKSLGIDRILHPFDLVQTDDGYEFSEDFSFCYRYRKAGGSVWAHVGHQITHVGLERFKANYKDVAKAMGWPIVETVGGGSNAQQ